MKTQLTFFSGALAAVMAVTPHLAAAPYTNNTAPAQPRYQPNTQVPVYGAAATYGAAPQQQAVPGYTYQPAAAQPYAQATQHAPGYTAPRVAYQPAPVTPGVAAAPRTQPVASPAPATAAYPATNYYQLANADCNCNTPSPAPVVDTYAPAPVDGACGCDAGYGGGYDCAAPACTAPCSYDCGPTRQWFAGIYGLYMERDRPYSVQTSVMTTGAPPSYYPMPTDTYLSSLSADTGYAAGAEVRLGCTFGCACDPCGCGTYQPFAWELVYWALDDDSSQGLLVDTLGGPQRMYGRINYSGLNLDRDGAGGTYGTRRLNDYNDYQPFPNVTPNDVRVLANRVRQNFQAQNLELNFWRFGPSYGGGAPAVSCGVAACGGACDAGCDPCAAPCGDACGAGCTTAACNCAPPQTFFISALAGVRFLQFDEYFQNGIYYTTDGDDDGIADAGQPSAYPNGFPPNDINHFLHDIDVDNDLVGFQLGCSMNCLVGCKWSLFADTNFGIYGNDIDVYQRVYNNGPGSVTFASTGADAVVRSSKQDVAFLGEARLGVGYQVSCHCRATLAWRVLGATGVALATDQIPDAGWTNPNAVGYIHSNGSLVLHGLQAGVECKY